MTSVRQVQIDKIITAMRKVLLSSGVRPSEYELRRAVSEYFAENPPGHPLDMSVNDTIVRGTRSDPDGINNLMMRVIMNLDTLYETTMLQSEEVMNLLTEMSDGLKLVRRKRREVNSRLDNILQSMYSTDGYLYSVSDTFSDTDMTDLDFTSSFVDVDAGCLTLPVTSYGSRRVPAGLIRQASVQSAAQGSQVSARTISEVSNAFDGLTNTVWHYEASVARPTYVTAILEITMAEVEITRIDIDPFGVTPAQWVVEYLAVDDEGTESFQPFGHRVKKSVDRIYYTSDPVTTRRLRFTITKDKHDYEEKGDGSPIYRYIFGAKELGIQYQAYDARGTYVSKPLSISESTGHKVIDSVSLTAKRETPEGTSMTIYVAEDNPEATVLGDFMWREIQPVDEASSPESTIIRFDGAELVNEMIYEREEGEGGLRRIPRDTVDPDLRERNPTTAILGGDPVYRVCKLGDIPLIESITLEEGVNHIEVTHAALNDPAVADIDWWATTGVPTQVDSVKVGSGYEFFHGRDVGESGRSVKVDALLDIDGEPPVIRANLRKNDSNSSTWKVRAYLNGREVGYLGNDSQQQPLTWAFRRGLNRITLLINIPLPTELVPRPYLGSLTLFDGTSILDLGSLNLGTLKYVDMFDMRNNQRDGDRTFSIHDDEIITRRDVQGDLRVRYYRDNGQGPEAVRVRVDMTRSNDHSTLTPVLDEYRLRFSYGLEVL